MNKNILMVMPIINGTLTPKKANKVFYVYEITEEGNLVQRHGVNVEGVLFPSRALAMDLVREKMASGQFIYEEKLAC